MGVSAISNINSYSQNAKDLNAYYTGLDNNDLPIIRGYSLNEDDLIRREIIQQLSCQFELDFNPIEDKYGIKIREYFSPELEQLALMGEDDLLRLQEDSIQITPRANALKPNKLSTAYGISYA